MGDLKRRAFLAATGAALLGQENAEPIGTGIIGTGGRGTFLLRGALELPGVKIVALCDIKPDRVDKAASLAARDNPQTFSDYRRLLDRKDVVAVYIATPCDLHAEMAIAALKAGKHVYCEKPVGITPEQIRELLKAGRSSKTVFQVGQQLRSNARLQKTMEKLREGVAGRIIMVKAQRHAGNDLDHNGSSADWFFNARRSGDVIVEMAVHNLDVCNWAIGAHPERAAGYGGTLMWVNDPPGRTNMDGYSLSYEYPKGVKMSFTQVFFHPDGMPNGGQYFNVYGTEGAVDVSNSTFYPRGRGAKPVTLVEKEATREQRGDAHIAAFLEAIRTGKKPPADLTIGAEAALTAILGRDSIYKKQALEWRDMGVDL